MKRKITLLLLAAASVFSVNAQVLLQENFTSPFNPATNGWNLQNLSQNATGGWFQGSGAIVFPAYNGGPNDYVGSNYAITTNTAAAQTLSNWLLTPTVNLINGVVVEFATRTTTNPSTYPDRLEVYYSTAGAGTNVGTTPTSVGTFSTLLVSVNPNLTATGYPGAWTVYTATITGVPVSTLGRVGFRYFVTNAGAPNADYIGLDAVKISSSCDQPTLSIAQSTNNICSGTSVSLTSSSTGTVVVSTYTWSGGQNTSSVVVTPSANTIYTLSATSNSGCVGTQTIAITATTTPTVTVPSYTACVAASTTTLMASGATTYSWSTGATTSSIVVSPSTNTFYTVTGYGAGGVCPGNTATTNITLSNQLAITISSTSNTLCAGRVATLTASGSTGSYTWTNPTMTVAPSITIAPTTSTTYSVGSFVGTLPNVCIGGNTITINVIPNPTIAVALNPAVICSDADFTVTTSGAVSYTYVLGSSTSTTNPIVLSAPVVNSLTPTAFIVGGSGANGCIAAVQVTLNVNPNPTVTAAPSSPTVCLNNTVTLTGSGANTYQWSGASTSTDSPLTYSNATAGNKTFTITGTSLAGCTGTAVTSVSVVACNTNTNTNPVGLTAVTAKDETSIFPNPFTNEIKINVLEGNVVIYNTIGQIIITATVHDSETINTAELPKGAYLVKAFNSNGELVRTIKLIKN